MSGNSCPMPDMAWTLLGRSAGRLFVGGIVVPGNGPPVPGEWAAAAVGLVNTEGEKGAEVGGSCVRLAEGEVADCSSAAPVESSAFLRFLRE